MKKVLILAISCLCLFCSCSKNDEPEIDKVNHHEFVDLGLSVKWATCNLGATSPEEAGDYYGWGSIIKNDHNGWFGDNSITEISGTELDAAHIEWGGKWRIPTIDEMIELQNECEWRWTTISGQNGYTVTGPSGKSIFIPAVSCLHKNLDTFGEEGFYWTSTRHSSGYNASGMKFSKNDIHITGWNIPDLFSIRPVSD